MKPPPIRHCLFLIALAALPLSVGAPAAPLLTRLSDQDIPAGNLVRYTVRLNAASPFNDTLTHHRLITAGRADTETVLARLESLASARGAALLRLESAYGTPPIFAVREPGSPPTLGTLWKDASEPWIHLIQVTLDPALLSQPEHFESHLHAWRHRLLQLSSSPSPSLQP